MKVNEIIHGFEVKRIRNLKDTGGTLIEMEHVKSGAQLIYHDRKDANKTFAITFKTLPADNTGVFHILEHSVLNGSRKYPVREPFVELLKGSMQTFLNAFTYSDKTMYPVSSRNDRDFMNLMSVYMDAVFHPAIYENPNIFYQEGWHYEIRKPEDEPVYKGVVLNEMKGAYSSVDESIINTLNHMLFRDNCYQYESGGNPENITDLSYEQFIATHRKFYHPSNARIWLDGSMDIEQVLQFMDEEYLGTYTREDMDFTIPEQKNVPAETQKFFYEANEEDGTEHRTHVAYAKIVSRFDDMKKNLAWQVLSSILVASNESPLKKNILENGLGEDVELELFDGIQQPWAVLVVRNTDEEKLDQVKDTVQKTVSSLVKNGLDQKQIEATLNQMEFRYREKHEPAGLMYGQRAMDSWLYDGDPAQNLSLGCLFDELRKEAGTGYYENLLKEFLLEDDYVTAVALPSLSLGKEREEKERKKLLTWKENAEDLNSCIELNRKLDEWQATPDSEEQLATLPHLQLTDVSEKPFELKCEETQLKGVPVYVHPEEDSGIVYMNLYFSLAGITVQSLPSLAFYSSLFLNLRTEKHSVEQLQQMVRNDLGSLSFFIDAYTPNGTKDACIPVLGISCSVLKEKTDRAAELIDEIIHETVFDEDAILPLLKQDNEDFRQNMIASGQAIAGRRVSAHYCAEGVFREYTGGYSSYVYEKDLEKNYSEKAHMFVQECQLYSEVLFSVSRLTASITGENFLGTIEKIIDCLGHAEGMRAKMHYPYLTEKKEAIVIPGGVSYSACGNDTLLINGSVDNRMSVIAHLLTYDWLWSEVRVRGGSYGTGFGASTTGLIHAYSYRDPDVKNALHAFRTCGKRLEELAEENYDLSSMIIGTIAEAEPLLSPAASVRVADVWKFREIDYDLRTANRKRLLNMKAEDLAELAPVITRAMNEGAVCIVGNRATVESLEGYTRID